MMMNLLDEIKVILVETSHTGNMGSAARAMKTMGLSQLCLVNPIIQPDSQSISLAAGAHDLIKNVEIVKTLDEAVKDCQLIIGTSARSRTLTWPHLSSNEAGEQIISERLKGHKVALIFGRERVGLTNEELQKCHFHVSIPTNAEYGSLNLAMSVQILCYEVRQAFLRYENRAQQSPTETSNEDKIVYPTGDELEHFYHHLEETLQKTGFISREQPKQIMGRLRRLFTRARVEDQELNILRGILASIDQSTAETKKPDQ